MIPEPLSVLLDGAEFRAALPFGLGALAIGAAAGVAWRRAGRSGPAPIGGLLVAAAAALAIRVPVSAPRVDDPDLSAGLAAGLALLAAAGVAADATGRPTVVAAALAVPGAWFVAYQSGLVDTAWVRAAVAVGTLAGGTLAAVAEQPPGRAGLGPPLLALSALGVYFTVPDTEEAMVLLAVAGPVAVLGWPLRIAALGTGGAMAAAGLLAWTVAAGGYGRSSSIVGGLGCLGLLVLEPVARRIAPAHPRASAPRAAPAVFVLSVHLAVVYLASRVVGVRRGVDEALALAGGLLVVGGAGTTLARRAAARGQAPGPGVRTAAGAPADRPQETGRGRRRPPAGPGDRRLRRPRDGG